MSLDEAQELDDDLLAGAPSRRPLVAGLAAGLWALLIGVALVTCTVMVAWTVAPNAAGDAASAWRASGLVWLGAHLVPLQVGGLELTLLPVGALLLGLLLARRGGRWAGRLLVRPTASEVTGIVVAGSLAYGMGGAGVAWLSAGRSAAAEPVASLLGTAIVAAVGLLWGVATEAELVGAARARLSDAAQRTIRAGLFAAIGLFAAGALLVGASLVRHFPQVAGTLGALDAGFVGSALMTLLGVLALPTLDVWGMAVVVGPGFGAGAAGSLSAFGGEVGALPALPVLAAIPAVPPGWAPALLLVPVLLGGLSSRIRWGCDLPTPAGALGGAAGLAGVVAVLVAGMVWLSSGSLGGGELADLGPRMLPVVASAAGLVALGFLLDAGLQSLHLWWQLYRADQRAARGRGPAPEVSPGMATVVLLGGEPRGDGHDRRADPSPANVDLSATVPLHRSASDAVQA